MAELKPNQIVRGSILPEPVKVLAVTPMGDSLKLIGEGLKTSQVHQPILTQAQVAELEIAPEETPFDGDAERFRLGVERVDTERLRKIAGRDPSALGWRNLCAVDLESR